MSDLKTTREAVYERKENPCTDCYCCSPGGPGRCASLCYRKRSVVGNVGGGHCWRRFGVGDRNWSCTRGLAVLWGGLSAFEVISFCGILGLPRVAHLTCLCSER